MGKGILIRSPWVGKRSLHKNSQSHSRILRILKNKICVWVYEFDDGYHKEYLIFEMRMRETSGIPRFSKTLVWYPRGGVADSNLEV